MGAVPAWGIQSWPLSCEGSIAPHPAQVAVLGLLTTLVYARKASKTVSTLLRDVGLGHSAFQMANTQLTPLSELLPPRSAEICGFLEKLLDLLQGGVGTVLLDPECGSPNLSLGVPATPVPGEEPPLCVSCQVGTGPLLLDTEVHALEAAIGFRASAV